MPVLLGLTLAALVYFHDSDLVLLREHLNHPFALGALACLLMAWAAAGLRRRWLRVLIGVLAGPRSGWPTGGHSPWPWTLRRVGPRPPPPSIVEIDRRR